MAERADPVPEFTRTGGYTGRNVGLSNPQDDGATDLPRLLRRVADLIEVEGITAMEILDVVVHHTMTGDGPWWSVTVHWSPDSPDDDAPEDAEKPSDETAFLLRAAVDAPLVTAPASLAPAAVIRLARADDVGHLPGIERAAGQAFRSLGMAAIADDGPIPADTLDGYRRAGRAWAAVDAGDRPVGYLLLDAVDGAGHVEQVTVHPRARGQRLGAALLDAAQGWSARHASGALTLTTFADVPWNAPYYRRLGFADVTDEDLGPGLRAVVAHEASSGLSAWPRVAMLRATVDR